MEHFQRTFIELALKHQALRFGEFTLKSGRQSPYFFNVGQLSNGATLKTLGECYANAISHAKLSFDMVFGPAYKGIPLVCTTSIALTSHHQRNIPFCYNRKETKEHGEGGKFIGSPLQGRVLIIDDVITAGTAIKEAVGLIQSHSAQVAGLIVALDRQEKGQNNCSALQEIQQTFNIPVVAIIHFTDILRFVEKEPDFSNYTLPLNLYRERWGQA